MAETRAQRARQAGEQAPPELPRAPQVLPLIEYLARIARRAYDTCQEPGCLRPRHLIALSLLHDGGPLSQQALGEALSLDPSNVVGLLNELEERGLIVRQRDPADRRRHIVSLSDAGKSELAATGTQRASIEDDLLVALSPAERTMLRDLLVRVAGGAVLANMAPAHGACDAPTTAATSY
jgi:MarR family transcriptional regulator, lower aerobic nicotinate degradation pathway regulator